MPLINSQMSLDNNQMLAVTYGEGALLVSAGPGSGKTTVLTHRIKFIIENLKISPNQILVITFTKSAAVQMKNRFTDLMDGAYYPVSFGTFHAIFYSIILSLKGNNISIINERQKQDIIRDIIRDYRLKIDIADVSLLLSEFSFIKNKGINIRDYRPLSCNDDAFGIMYDNYNKYMRNAGKIDFDDMMVRCLELLKDNHNYLNSLQDKYRYILIDEFQDINPLQFEIVCLLSQKYGNIFAVGDEDQSIYSFRGSSPEIMLDFSKRREVNNCILATNYRCHSEITDAARRLISHNKFRMEKVIVSVGEQNNKLVHNSFDIQNNEIVLKDGFQVSKFKSIYDEYFAIIKILQQLKSNNELLNTAILYRTNSIPHDLFMLLKKYDIPFVLKEKPESIVNHFIFKDIESYIRIAGGYIELKDFLRICNRPNRYISRNFVVKCLNLSANYGNDKYIDRRVLLKEARTEKYLYKNINILFNQCDRLKNMSAYLSINYIRSVMGYDEFLAKYAFENNKSFNEYRLFLDTLQKYSKDFEDITEFFEYMKNCDELINNDIGGTNNNAKAGVQIMTFHSAKGLEWDNCFIPDVNMNKIPHKKAREESEIEEERRVFYVGLTRAKKRLCVAFVDSKDEGLYKSHFIDEILE